MLTIWNSASSVECFHRAVLHIHGILASNPLLGIAGYGFMDRSYAGIGPGVLLFRFPLSLLNFKVSLKTPKTYSGSTLLFSGFNIAQTQYLITRSKAFLVTIRPCVQYCFLLPQRHSTYALRPVENLFQASPSGTIFNSHSTRRRVRFPTLGINYHFGENRYRLDTSAMAVKDTYGILRNTLGKRTAAAPNQHHHLATPHRGARMLPDLLEPRTLPLACWVSMQRNRLAPLDVDTAVTPPERRQPLRVALRATDTPLLFPLLPSSPITPPAGAWYPVPASHTDVLRAISEVLGLVACGALQAALPDRCCLAAAAVLSRSRASDQGRDVPFVAVAIHFPLLSFDTYSILRNTVGKYAQQQRTGHHDLDRRHVTATTRRRQPSSNDLATPLGVRHMLQDLAPRKWRVASNPGRSRSRWQRTTSVCDAGTGYQAPAGGVIGLDGRSGKRRGVSVARSATRSGCRLSGGVTAVSTSRGANRLRCIDTQHAKGNVRGSSRSGSMRAPR
ncbi:hypothetical protein B0H11DRAFT_1911773 [Mycena galericulata]|nr:hypothetical protein B0H11DRAFT_1911773 [Mycena galericulata]